MNIVNTTFPVGTVKNQCTQVLEATPRALYSEIELKYPLRLNAMAVDPSKIDVDSRGVYSPGEIIFSVALFKSIKVTTREDGEVVVDKMSPRRSLARHAGLLMQSALGVSEGFTIMVGLENEYPHTGFGSSGCTIAGVACAINELYGNPIDKHTLLMYLAQNHGEEISDDDSLLQHVQCIGGSAASGLIAGGMVLILGESIPVFKMDVPETYTVVIGVPSRYMPDDAQKMMDVEEKNMDKFVQTGKRYGAHIAYQILHETIPAMAKRDLRRASEIVFKYRFDMGSIQNCSFVHPPILDIADNIRYLYEEGIADTLALSSVGPAFFSITKFPEKCENIFAENEMRTFVTKVNNTGYSVKARQ